MSAERVTIMAEKALIDRVSKHTEETGETLTHFYNRAILNQLENDGDFEIRDEMEVHTNESKDNT